jgi:hypothetical protein
MYSGEYDVCDVTLSVYPHRASLKNMPGHVKGFNPNSKPLPQLTEWCRLHPTKNVFTPPLK